MSRKLSIAGVDLELHEKGSGRPLLFLHSGEGLYPERAWFDAMAKNFRVIAPCHPGWGQSSLPDWFGSVDDIAYLYLDLATKLDLQDAVLVGNSFGGWIAAEMLVRSQTHFSKLVLADPLGIKISGRNERDIADMHAMACADYMRAAWADPAKGAIDYTKLPETELAAVVRGREALALFGWKPYMHNPRLKNWLHRITVPSLVLWGEQDKIISKSYCEAWAKALPNAKLETIAGAGHYPQWEQPEEMARKVAGFVGK
jgi:pimeloyl-ACP methyl ester carboxylesterase